MTLDLYIEKRVSELPKAKEEAVRFAAKSAFEAYPGKKTPTLHGYTFKKWLHGATPFLEEVEFEKFVAVFQSKNNEKEWMLAFKGSATKWDWWEDMKWKFVDFPFFQSPVAGSFEVELGFKEIYATNISGTKTSLQWQLMNFINDEKPYSLKIAGHSLGSALAEIFTYDLLKTKEVYKPNLLEHINFACPKTFNYGAAVDFRNLLNQDYSALRIVNEHDLVPKLPEFGKQDISFWYYHATNYFLMEFKPEDDHFSDDFYAYHSMVNYQNVINKINMQLPISNPQRGKCSGVRLNSEFKIIPTTLDYQIPK